MITSFQQAEQFINNRNNLGIKLGLERILLLLQHVGNPHQHLNAIHVTGTNGKGSTINLLENALFESNYTVGVFSSPSLTGLRGHITLNKMEISEVEFIDLLNTLMTPIKNLDNENDHPTSFEILTVISFMFFQRHAELCLIETGMGGKDDTTNVMEPLLSIITNVEKDHTTFLGTTYAEIATHKAGIIKENRPVIIGKVNEESALVITNKAILENAAQYRLEKDFIVRKSKGKYTWSYNSTKFSFLINNLPNYQINNIANVFMALTLLQSYNYNICWRKFLNHLSSTSLPGRFELICSNPPILLDSAHNVSAIKALVDAIGEKYKTNTKQVLFSAFNDKDVAEMIEILKRNFNRIALSTFSHERAITQTELRRFENNEILIKDNWQQQIDEMFQQGKQNHLSVITGSFHFIAIVRQYILHKCSK